MLYVPAGTPPMVKLPAPSPRPTNTVLSVPLSLSATYGLATGSPMVRWSNGGQPCQLRALPVIVPVPGVGKVSAVQSNPNQYPVRRFGGSHRTSPGAPVPSLPSSTPACTSKPPSNVLVCTHVPEPSGPQPVSGGVTSMKYVAGPRLSICTKPSDSVTQSPPHSGSLW